MSETALGNCPLILDAIDPDHAIACFQDICLVVWAGSISARSIAGLSDALRAAASGHPEGLLLLGIVKPDVPLAMSREARIWLASMLHEHAELLRGFAVVVEAEGIDRWLRRGLLSSIAGSSRGPQLQDVPDRMDAASWASERSKAASVTPPRLLEAIEQLTRRVQECRDPDHRRPDHSTVILPG